MPYRFTARAIAAEVDHANDVMQAGVAEDIERLREVLGQCWRTGARMPVLNVSISRPGPGSRRITTLEGP
ncbi:hypothetical protein [Streptomyces umbrinus]|uniref:hypothetical protein n=1 Tax=Streptomyces umbrinus TaxID=67370 RepID=UPI0033D30546